VIGRRAACGLAPRRLEAKDVLVLLRKKGVTVHHVTANGDYELVVYLEESLGQADLATVLLQSISARVVNPTRAVIFVSRTAVVTTGNRG
jgi:hypothetical protein